MRNIPINKKNHFNCKNCQQKTRVDFKNNVQFCFGLIIKKQHPKDYYRFCINKEKRNCTDIMEEELLGLIQGLSTLIVDYKFETINKKPNLKKGYCRYEDILYGERFCKLTGKLCTL